MRGSQVWYTHKAGSGLLPQAHTTLGPFAKQRSEFLKSAAAPSQLARTPYPVKRVAPGE